MMTAVLARREQPAAQLSVERARDILAQAKGVDEVKHVRDIAVAMKAYARTQKAGKAIAVDAGEIILRADARMGELARELPKAPPPSKGTVRRADRTLTVSKQAALADLGATKQRASEWERVASLSEKERDAYVAACRKAEEPPTTAGAVALAKLDAPVRKQVIAKLGDVPSVKRAIAEVKRGSATHDDVPHAKGEPVAAEKTWHASDEVARVEVLVRDVVTRWRGANLMPLADALHMVTEEVEEEHARRNRK